MSKIPIIDISPYLDGSNKEVVAKEVGQACKDVGFFMIKGHGIPMNLVERIETEAVGFFDQSVKIKMETMAPFGLGYMGDGVENVAATIDENSKIKDRKESLNLTLPVREKVWPLQFPSFNEVCERYYTMVLELAQQLMRIFALALDLEEGHFDDKVNDPYTTLRILNYPAIYSEGPMIRNAEHTDYGTLTILWSSDSRGLQAKSRDDNEWIDVYAPKDHFIINIGDLMMNWTNDRWVSTLHRVVAHPQTIGRRRMSIPFFHNPNPDAIVECVTAENEEAKYEPIVAKDHLEEKVRRALGQN